MPDEPVVSAARQARAIVPTVQAAAVAAGGFVAGAAAAGLVRRRRHRRELGALAARTGESSPVADAGGAQGGELLQIVGSRSLLVDVHLLGPAATAERRALAGRCATCRGAARGARRGAPRGVFRLPREAAWTGCCAGAARVLERLLHHDEEPVVVRVAQTAPDRVLFGARASTRAAADTGSRGCASRSASTTT